MDANVFCNMLLETDFRFRRTLAEDLSVYGVAVGEESEENQWTDGRGWVRQTILDEMSPTPPNLILPTSGVVMKAFARESMPKLLRVSSLAVG